MKKKAKGFYYRVGIVVILALVVLVVIVIKSGGTKGQTNIKLIEDIEESAGSLAWHRPQTDSGSTENMSTGMKTIDNINEEQVGKESGSVKSSPSLSKNVLATVNGEEVTLSALNREFDALPPQYREYFKDDKAGFLEELILKQLLLQDAQRKKVPEQAGYKTVVAKNPSQREQIMINFLLQEVVANMTINESELREFFDQYTDQFPNKDYESVKEQIGPMALEEKQRVVIEDYINGLKSNAEIVRNEQWIKAQESLVADNPLSKALKSGKPVVADFGRGTCIPCKMMQPILEKLQKDFAGKAEILILDVGDYASLSRKYRIMMIPTQIFFDANGEEVHRHQGFMSEADIVAQLKKMGVK